ncbi:DNA polymerase III subunits gamma and tau [Candidatus Syntrophocurvum alkaliphilum]|uniref:DNA-directed DNA polymerase n=1 Tax=Candidatus Syntrophocurvum alkaliphilum TaxID=2293317 RepID=A0A6I6DNV8_9FIRM|nr:DNA polymerase III subunit gamma/tau [Candidatus Syntrophocurvum alkaliphilum]QGU00598.1 DNA polymerase III subunits gamma and tau [Candidatus Syntrophocurvum alkaliphilum]
MAYLALYRVWRPQQFIDVVGQEKTVTALKNAVRESKLSHAYLFSGPRGTGKTSIAKILAKAVNCELKEQGEPCNDCSSCKDINNNTFMDVIEIDAASNRGIDEIRDLREKVRVLPAQGKVKVYIIDEVHMLTTEAFNALLKTLEEPPSSVLFILATTEHRKIPPTILSRCQNYTFHRLTDDEIVNRLKQVAKANSIEIEDESIKTISRRADGGMRDALSMLDQIYTYKGNNITKRDVMDVLGLIDDEFMAKLVGASINNDIILITKLLDSALKEGKESQQIAKETALYLRDLLFYKLLKEKAVLSTVSEHNIKILSEQEKSITKEKILEAIKLMLDTAERIKFSDGQKHLLEIAIINMATLLTSNKSEKEEINKQQHIPLDNDNEDQFQKNSEKNDTKDIIWSKILKEVKDKKIPTHALLAQGKLIGLKGDTLYIGYKKGYKFHKEKMEEKQNREILDQALEEVLGKKIEVQFIFLDDNQYNDIIVKKAIEYFGEEAVEIKE